MMKTFLGILGLIAFFVLLILWSVWLETETLYYVYNTQVVKRVDTPGKSTFYYLKGDKEMTKTWAKYSGINDGFSSYLVFQQGRITIYNGDGYFEMSETDTTIISEKRIGGGEEPNDSANVFRISYPYEYEPERNINSKTKVVRIHVD